MLKAGPATPGYNDELFKQDGTSWSALEQAAQSALREVVARDGGERFQAWPAATWAPVPKITSECDSCTRSMSNASLNVNPRA